MLYLSPLAGVGAQLFDNNGVPLAGGLLYTYEAGTSTPLVTYTSPAGNIPNSNPIVLDSAGRPPQEIWLEGDFAYKFVLQNASAVQIWSYDNIVGINSGTLSFTLSDEVFTATQGQTVFTLTTMSYEPGVNNLSVYVNGSKQIVNQNYTETSSTIVTFVSGLNVGDIVEFITAVPATTNPLSSDDVSYNEGGTGAVARSLTSKLQESLSVLDFGADPTGTTDSTTAILAACTAAMENSSTAYLSVIFPAGTYKFTNLTISPQISLVADGDVILTTSIANGNAITVSNIAGNANIPYRNKVMSGNFYITNTNATNTATGIFIGDTPPSTTYTAANCTFENIAVYGFGVGHTYGNNAYLITWTNCQFSGRGNTVTNYGLVQTTALTNSGENLLYVGCIISEYTYGMYLLNANIEITYVGGSMDANGSNEANEASQSIVRFESTHFEWLTSTQPLFNINGSSWSFINCYFVYDGSTTTSSSSFIAAVGGTGGSCAIIAPVYNIGVTTIPYYIVSSSTSSIKIGKPVKQFGTTPSPIVTNPGGGIVSTYLESTDIPQVLSSSGYAKLPPDPVSGQQLIYQWGTVTTTGANTFINWTYPIAFPNAVVSVQATPNYSGSAAYANTHSPSTSAAAIESSVACSVYCFAIGY